MLEQESWDMRYIVILQSKSHFAVANIVVSKIFTGFVNRNSFLITSKPILQCHKALPNCKIDLLTCCTSHLGMSLKGVFSLTFSLQCDVFYVTTITFTYSSTTLRTQDCLCELVPLCIGQHAFYDGSPHVFI